MADGRACRRCLLCDPGRAPPVGGGMSSTTMRFALGALLSALAAVACGGDVVVDGKPTGASGSGGSGASAGDDDGSSDDDGSGDGDDGSSDGDGSSSPS